MKKRGLLSAGFTLVELMIVICTIVILATILILSYDAYLDRTDQTNIATTVDAYAKTMRGYGLEYGSYPKNSTCLPQNSKCCTTTATTAGTVYCLQTSDLSTYNWSSANDSNIAKYVNNQAPVMPVVDTWTPCTSGLMNNGPCKPAGSYPIVGVTYITNQPGSSFTSSDTTLTNKGFLVYFVDTKFTCGSKDLMRLSGTDLVFDSSLSYTTQTSSYNLCIVGLRS